MNEKWIIKKMSSIHCVMQPVASIRGLINNIIGFPFVWIEFCWNEKIIIVWKALILVANRPEMFLLVPNGFFALRSNRSIIHGISIHRITWKRKRKSILKFMIHGNVFLTLAMKTIKKNVSHDSVKCWNVRTLDKWKGLNQA